MTAIGRSGLLSAFLALSASATVTWADCAPLERGVREAVQTGSAADAERIYRQAEASVCSSAVLVRMAHNVAVAYGREAFAGDKSAAERARLLKIGLGFSRPWQLVANLADLERGLKRYTEAAALYQEALDTISDETCAREELPAKPACRDVEPPTEVIAKVHAKAVEARLLAERYVAAPITRSGEPGGLARRAFRGFSPKAVAVPVHFEYNSDAFTPEGLKAVADMYEYLARQHSPDIRLVGHTDPTGSQEFNLPLSERRAEAVKRYLAGRGYKGAIHATGRGKLESFQADDPGSLTEAQRHQLDRRVELARQ